MRVMLGCFVFSFTKKWKIYIPSSCLQLNQHGFDSWQSSFCQAKTVNFLRLAGCLHHVWYEPAHDKTKKITCAPAKTQISLGIHPVWSQSLLCTQWAAKDPRLLHADGKDSDQTGQMTRLIWIFTGRTSFFWFCRVQAQLWKSLRHN